MIRHAREFLAGFDEQRPDINDKLIIAVAILGVLLTGLV